jgi:hypothetical protein
MPVPVSLTADHLVTALVPATPDEATGDPRPHLQLGIDRVDTIASIVAAWRDKLVLLPEPPRRQTLHELVQAARRRLRDDRVRLDVEELDDRRFVLQRVLEELST